MQRHRSQQSGRRGGGIIAEPALVRQGLYAPGLHAARYRGGRYGQQHRGGAGGAGASVAAKVLDTGAFRVSISLADGTLTFLDASAGQGDRILLQEMGERPRVYDPVKLSDGQNAFKVTERFHPVLRQGIYGLGQHQGGQFNYQGGVVRLAQANTDIAHPLMVSTEGYGLLWNTAAASTMDNRFPTEMTLQADAAQAIDYLFIHGPEFDDIIGAYRRLTGQAPLFPRWAYGLFQSMDHYDSAQDLLDVTARHRAADAPVDVVVQDWKWWSRMGKRGHARRQAGSFGALFPALQRTSVRSFR